MARLKFKNTVPPGGWIYLVPETRLTITSDGFDALVSRVIEHRGFRGLPTVPREEIALRIERQICTRLGTGECRAEEGDTWVPREVKGPKITLSMVLEFSRTILAWIGAGAALVPEAERERRAEICSSCPLNQRIPGCACSAFYRAVNRAIPEARRQDDLHVCGVCSCTVNGLVNIPKEALDAGHRGRDLKFPIHCWQSPPDQT